MDDLDFIKAIVEAGALCVAVCFGLWLLSRLGYYLIDRAFNSYKGLSEAIDNLTRAIEKGNIIDDKIDATLKENTNVLRGWKDTALGEFEILKRKLDKQESSQSEMDGKLVEIVAALADISTKLKQQSEILTKQSTLIQGSNEEIVSALAKIVTQLAGLAEALEIEVTKKSEVKKEIKTDE